MEPRNHGLTRRLWLYVTLGFVWAMLSGRSILAAPDPGGRTTEQFVLTLVGQYADAEFEAKSVDISGERAYVTAGTAALYTFNIADPSNPSVLGRFEPLSAEMLAVSAAYPYVYIVNGGLGWQIVDVSTPDSPVETATYHNGYPAVGLDVEDEHIYLTWDAGMTILNVENRAAPRVVGFYETPSYASRVVVQNGRAYITVRTFDEPATRLMILDLADLSTPQLLGQRTLPVFSGGLAVAGNRAFVAHLDGGVTILDVSDPTNIEVVSTLTLPGQVWSVAYLADRLYLAAGSAGLQVVDLTEESAPVLLDSYDTPGVAETVAVSGESIYVADSSGGLMIFQLTDNPIGSDEETLIYLPTLSR